MSDFYRRNLPHYQPSGGEFFVTFRLVNSLPKSVIDKLKQEVNYERKVADKTTRSQLDKKYFAKFDTLLDNSKKGNFWLQKNDIAKIVTDKLHDFDNQKYKLICYCIMPNHVHVLFKLPKRDKSRSTNSDFPVTNILKLIKGSTAREANKVLGRKGSFWQHESYDHLVRDDDERERIIRYILRNPLKARLVENWNDWKWTYCKEKYFPTR